MWSGIWHYTQTVGCRERRVDVAVLVTSRCDTAKSSSTSWVHLYHHHVVTYNFDISGCQNYRECAAQCSGCMSNRQSTVDVCQANIGDQSRACETRSCLFWYPRSGVYICTDIHTECSTYCIVFVLLIKISELYIISKSHGRAVQKTDYVHHFLLQQTMYYYYCCIDTGVQGANIGDQSRACETRLCLFLNPCIGVDLCTDIRTD